MFINYINFFIFLFSCIFIILFFNNKKNNLLKGSLLELKKITWISYKETFHISIIVIMIIFLVSIIIWILDSLLIYLMSIISNY